MFSSAAHTGLGFPGDSDNKESACNAGDLGSIPGLGRSSGDLPISVFWCREFHGVTKSQT